jgi:hypothetical protein
MDQPERPKNQGFGQSARKKSNPPNLYKSMTYVRWKRFDAAKKKSSSWCMGSTFLCISQPPK